MENEKMERELDYIDMREGVFLVGDPCCFLDESKKRELSTWDYIEFSTQKEYGPYVDSQGFNYLGDTGTFAVMRISDRTIPLLNEDAMDFGVMKQNCKIVLNPSSARVTMEDGVIHFGELKIFTSEDHYAWPGEAEHDSSEDHEILKKEYRDD